MLKSLVRPIVAIALAVLLVACGTGGGPNRQLVKQAISLQLSQTQQELSEQLRLSSAESPKFQVKHVVIQEQQPLTIQDLSAYKVGGTYDLNVTLPEQRLTERQNPFEVYLQRQPEGKTWRLARPQLGGEDTESTWETYLIEQ